MASHGKPWQVVASRGKPWQAVASRGKPWQAVASRGKPWQPCVVPTALSVALSWHATAVPRHVGRAHPRRMCIPPNMTPHGAVTEQKKQKANFGITPYRLRVLDGILLPQRDGFGTRRVGHTATSQQKGLCFVGICLVCLQYMPARYHDAVHVEHGTP